MKRHHQRRLAVFVVVVIATAGVVALSCSSPDFGDVSSGGSSGPVRPSCDFNTLFTVSVRSFKPTDGGGAVDAGIDAGEDATTVDADAEPNAVVDAAALEADTSTNEDSGLVSGRARTTTVNLVSKAFSSAGEPLFAGAFVVDDAGDAVIGIRQRDVGYDIDVDTSASNAFVLRLTSAAHCSVGLQSVLLDVRLLDNGVVNTVRASIPGEPDVPVPVD